MIENTEYAVIGHALRNKEHYDYLMAEFTVDHFTDHEVRYTFEIMTNDFKHNIRTTSEMLLQRPRSTNFVMNAHSQSTASANPDNDFLVLEKEFQKLQYRNMANQLSILTAGDFESEHAEAIINKYMPFSKEGTNNEYAVTAKDAADKALKEFEIRIANPGVVQGVSLSYKTSQGATGGFRAIDDVLCGLRGGDLIMISAQSGHGKTALAMNLTRIMSFHNNNHVYYLNTEMDITQMVDRWSAMATKVDYTKINNGTTDEQETARVREFNAIFSESPITLSRIPSLTPNLVKALTKREMGKHRVDCVVVDYIGRMDTDTQKNIPEWQAMSEIAKRLKEIAQSLNVPLIVLAQLNDDGKLEGAKKMKNECDGLFFFRPKKIESENELGEKVTKFSESEYYLVKEKVRRGNPAGDIQYKFLKEYQFISEV